MNWWKLKRLVESTTERELLECPCDMVTDGKSVDRAASVIKNVKLVGLKAASKNREYDPAAIRDAAPLYEGAAVYLNHSHGEKEAPPKVPPSPANMIAVVRGVRFAEGEGLRGDLHLSPRHPYAEHVMWFAESAPNRLGMSHDALGMVQVIGGVERVKKITKVRSVDLVTDPATTAGLFESRERGSGGDRSPGSDSPPGAKTMDLKDLTEATLATDRPDLVKSIRERALSECAQSEQAKADKKELETLRLEKSIRDRQTLVEAKLKESKLPENVVTDEFRQQLVNAKDEAQIDGLITDRVKLVESLGTKTPPAGAKSREGKLTETSKSTPAFDFKDSKDFASAFKRI